MQKTLHLTTLDLAANKLPSQQTFCAYHVPTVNAGRRISVSPVGSNQPAGRREVVGPHKWRSASIKRGYNPEPPTVPSGLCSAPWLCSLLWARFSIICESATMVPSSPYQFINSWIKKISFWWLQQKPQVS